MIRGLLMRCGGLLVSNDNDIVDQCPNVFSMLSYINMITALLAQQPFPGGNFKKGFV